MADTPPGTYTPIAPREIIFVQNWFDELRRLVPVN